MTPIAKPQGEDVPLLREVVTVVVGLGLATFLVMLIQRF